MTFYYRTSELEALTSANQQLKNGGQMSVLLGRRRIGKTSLALEFVKDKPFVYLFVAKKAEALLCQSFIQDINQKFDLPIYGEVTEFSKLFESLMAYAKTNPLTVIIDEFQEFYYINPSVYSELQCIWDLNKHTSKMHIIFIGSVYSMMHKIFENSKEPLFGRADRILNLKPFSVVQLFEILKQHNVNDLNSLFNFYMITGGVPKYLNLLLDNNCFTFDAMIEFMLRDNSPFLNEGRHQLIDEFGKDYTIYFSILELIASGKTGSAEIASVIQKNISAYLAKLSEDYQIIDVVKPINAKPQSKLNKYYIRDNFLQFWFRFFHRYRSAIEIGRYDFIHTVIKRDIASYSGRVLERFFFDLMVSSKRYNHMGAYWEREGKNEIDIVAVDDLNHKLVLAEIKRDKRRHAMARLMQRAGKLLQAYPDYEVEYLTLSLEDAVEYLST